MHRSLLTINGLWSGGDLKHVLLLLLLFILIRMVQRLLLFASLTERHRRTVDAVEPVALNFFTTGVTAE